MNKSLTTNQKIVRYVAFAIWLTINIGFCISHEPFRDEAQSWMIARDNSIFGMIDFMWEEGHPWLYHLMLWPLAHLGFPYAALKYTALVLAACAMLLYARHAPFNTPIVCLTMCLPFINYYISAFARPYTLIFLFGVMLSISWKTRKERPWFTGLCIGLLACTHLSLWIPSFILALALLIEEITDKKVSVGAILACVIPVAIFCGPLLPQVTSTMERKNLPLWLLFAGAALVIMVTAAIVILAVKHNRKKGGYDRQTLGRFWLSITIIGTLAVPLVAIVLTATTPTAQMTERYLLIVVPVALMFRWISYIKKQELPETEKEKSTSPMFKKYMKGLEIAFVALAVVICIFSDCYKMALADVVAPYSRGDITAKYIDENFSEEDVLVTSHQGTVTSVIVQTNHPIINITGNVQTYTKWFDEWEEERPMSKWLPELKQISDSAGKEIYVIYMPVCEFIGFTDWYNEKVEAGQARELYRPSGNTIDLGEQYKIVEIDMNAFNDAEEYLKKEGTAKSNGK